MLMGTFQRGAMQRSMQGGGRLYRWWAGSCRPHSCSRCHPTWHHRCMIALTTLVGKPAQGARHESQGHAASHRQPVLQRRRHVLKACRRQPSITRMGQSNEKGTTFSVQYKTWRVTPAALRASSCSQPEARTWWQREGDIAGAGEVDVQGAPVVPFWHVLQVVGGTQQQCPASGATQSRGWQGRKCNGNGRRLFTMGKLCGATNKVWTCLPPVSTCLHPPSAPVVHVFVIKLPLALGHQEAKCQCRRADRF